MWTSPKEVAIDNAMWKILDDNQHIVLQKIMGSVGGTLKRLLGGSLDDKTSKYRIVLKSDEDGLGYQICISKSETSIRQCWTVMERSILTDMDELSREDAVGFITSRIMGLLDVPDGGKNVLYERAAEKFLNLFHLPVEEKLVNNYACSHWVGGLLTRGWMYLSVNHACFFSSIMIKEVRVVIPWVQVWSLDKSSNFLGPESITIKVKDKKVGQMFTVGNSGTEEKRRALKDSNIIANGMYHAVEECVARSVFEPDRYSIISRYNSFKFSKFLIGQTNFRLIKSLNDFYWTDFYVK